MTGMKKNIPIASSAGPAKKSAARLPPPSMAIDQPPPFFQDDIHMPVQLLHSFLRGVDFNRDQVNIFPRLLRDLLPLRHFGCRDRMFQLLKECGSVLVLCQSLVPPGLDPPRQVSG